MTQVRVRFAPSPTGFFHIGSARTALFNWLYARHTGGVFVLRIEDTDAARNREEYLRVIYDSLAWLGLNWDEGPQVGTNGGGDFGPYRQSERAQIYRDYLNRLRDAGRAYDRDGAVWFKLLGERHEVYDEHRKKTVVKVKNTPAVIHDLIRGRVERVEDEDFVIMRADGNPVFHLVNVVDDITMRITHVIRGEDHLSNTSKHMELFQALGVPPPAYAHIPLILKQTGPGKMSKRDQGALCEEYQQRGFLPAALVNFLSLLGWNPGDDREKMPIDEIIQLFDLPGVNQSNARFDEKKLTHMNMVYLLELPAEEFVQRAREHFQSRLAHFDSSPDTPPVPTAAQPNLPPPPTREVFLAALNANPAYFREVIVLCQPKIKELQDLPAYTTYFFSDDFPVEPKARDKLKGKGDPAARLRELAEALSAADFSQDTAIEEAIKVLAAARGLAFGDYQPIARLALSGTNVGPSLTSMMRVFGRDRVLDRLGRFELV